jgi:hypothetical protein
MQGASDVLADPMFAGAWSVPPATNLELSKGSPAIGAGVTLSAVPDDFLGAMRPSSGYDLGAFQYGATPPGDGGVVGPGPDAGKGPAPDGGVAKGSDAGAGGGDGGHDAGSSSGPPGKAPSGGCSCSAPGSRPGDGGMLALLGLGAMIVAARRRRE